MTENTRKVFDYLKANNGVKMTASDIAEALDLDKRAVNGIVTSAFQKKGLAVRTQAEIEVTLPDGSVGHKAVKFVSLTEAGMALDPDAE